MNLRPFENGKADGLGLAWIARGLVGNGFFLEKDVGLRMNVGVL
jgi:hypothetical protein